MLQINMADKPDSVHPRMEKYLLRKAFDRPDSPYLPESVLWRQKEQFSDGVGYDWVDRLKDYSHEVCFLTQPHHPSTCAVPLPEQTFTAECRCSSQF